MLGLDALNDNRRAGWLGNGDFWNVLPFMHMLHVREELRERGLGTRLVTFWESQMRESGYDRAMTSTLSDKDAQHTSIGSSATRSVVAYSYPVNL